MAKSDFCFTYYDGDAARDMAHMNRLERGAYTDIMISQRKFGRLTLIQIQKILGRDFQECWGAVELVMKCVEEKYWIEWIETSETRAKKHSKLQKQRRSGATEQQPKSIPVNPNIQSGQPPVTPEGDGDGNGDEDQNKIEQAEQVKFWTNAAISGDDHVLEQMERVDADKTGVPWPSGFDRVKAILDHHDLSRRYKWTFDDQQHFRHSLLKVLRDSKKQQSNGSFKTTNKKQQHTADLVAAHARKFGGGAEHTAGAAGNIQVDDSPPAT